MDNHAVAIEKYLPRSRKGSSTPEALAKFQRAEIERWAKFLKEVNIMRE